MGRTGMHEPRDEPSQLQCNARAATQALADLLSNVAQLEVHSRLRV